jgi:hypothetical protein
VTALAFDTTNQRRARHHDDEIERRDVVVVHEHVRELAGVRHDDVERALLLGVLRRLGRHGPI